MIFKILLEGHKATAKRIDKIASGMNNRIKQAIAQEAHILRKIIVTGIRSQKPGGKQFKPLDPATIAMKKSSKALIHRGDLIRSITVKSLPGGNSYFVGVHKMSRGKDGKSLANIAEVHEFGTKNGRIPARPFLQPSFDEWRKDAVERIKKNLIKFIND